MGSLLAARSNLLDHGSVERRTRLLSLLIPLPLAILALCTVNLAAHHRFAISPYGNIFLLARILYDGPGMDALNRECPASHWRLCPYRNALPSTSDDFLWTSDSPLNRAGGPKAISAEADAIIRSALRVDPVREVKAALGNALRQLLEFRSGDGLTAWPAQVSPWINQDFPPREAAAYAASRQQSGTLSVPPLLAAIQAATAVAGIVACGLILPFALCRRMPAATFLLAVLLAIPLSAAITGALSAPHDRYQSRIMWLPPLVAALSIAAIRTATVSRADAQHRPGGVLPVSR